MACYRRMPSRGYVVCVFLSNASSDRLTAAIERKRRNEVQRTATDFRITSSRESSFTTLTTYQPKVRRHGARRAQ